MQGNIIINSPDTDVFSVSVLCAVVSVGIECFTKALVSIHAFTGCDTVSAFAGLGKSKAIKIMAKNFDYIKLLEKLGENLHLEEEIIKYIEGFVCHLYGYSEMKDINMLRYKLFCARKGDCSCVKLLSYQSSLKQHCLRANYQSKIWRDCLADEFFVPTPEGHGCIK